MVLKYRENRMNKTKGRSFKNDLQGTVTAVTHPTPGPNLMPLPFDKGTHVKKAAVVHNPAWTFHQRIEKKPNYYNASPNSYNVRNLKAKGGKASAPAYSMRIKNQARPLQELPGPSSYMSNTQYTLPRAPKFSFRSKPAVSALTPTPAPNEYNLPSLLGHHSAPPAFVMGHKLYRRASAATPGPGFYDHRYFLGNLSKAPQYTIREKVSQTTEQTTPGPGSYSPETVVITFPNTPRVSLGIKHSPKSGVWHPRIVGPHYC